MISQSASTKGNEKVKEDFTGAIFERMIIIMPYVAAIDTVKNIEETFEHLNLKNLKLASAKYLNTKELTEKERADRTLDFLSGFEIMD